MTNVKLIIGGTPGAGAFTLLDNKDLSVINATFSNQAVGQNSNPEIAAFSIGTDPNTVTATAIASGSGTVVLTASASWIDKGDQSSQTDDFTVTKTFIVVPSADGASLDVVFS